MSAPRSSITDRNGTEWDTSPLRDADGKVSKEGFAGELLATNPRTGLTESEAARRLELFGPNKLPEKEESLLGKFLEEFIQPMPVVIWLAMVMPCVLR